MHLIQNGAVHEIDVDPALANLFTLVDVAGLSPQPGIGWLYDAKTGAFSPPAPILPTRNAMEVYCLTMRDMLLSGGITVDIGDPKTPLPLSVDTTGDGRANILGLQKLNDLGHDIVWIESTGPATITRAQLDKIGEAAGLFVSSCYVAWANALKAIAGGTIKTFADVDAAASWPPTSV